LSSKPPIPKEVALWATTKRGISSEFLPLGPHKGAQQNQLVLKRRSQTTITTAKNGGFQIYIKNRKKPKMEFLLPGKKSGNRLSNIYPISIKNKVSNLENRK